MLNQAEARNLWKSWNEVLFSRLEPLLNFAWFVFFAPYSAGISTWEAFRPQKRKHMLCQAIGFNIGIHFACDAKRQTESQGSNTVPECNRTITMLYSQFLIPKIIYNASRAPNSLNTIRIEQIKLALIISDNNGPLSLRPVLTLSRPHQPFGLYLFWDKRHLHPMAPMMCTLDQSSVHGSNWGAEVIQTL